MKRKVWLVGRIIEEILDRDEVIWECCGIFTSQILAEKACYDEFCFVAPMRLNEIAPKDSLVFPDSYYPLDKEN